MKIAVLASGGGTTFQALYDAQKAGSLGGGEIVLVISSRPDAGVAARAKAAGVRAETADPKDDALLCRLCAEAGVRLVCMAGYMHKLGPEMLKRYAGAVLNIHPALLPAFGGKGMYGRHVHEAVIASGAKFSGCTVHFADGNYDAGPVALQQAVAVAEDDTAETLSEKVRAAERILYPRAVRLFCQGRLKISGGKVSVLPEKTEAGKIRRALISVYDKTGLAEFAKGLDGLGVEIISTSGTAKFLSENGVPVRMLETLTGFPEILGGRVKTLHPMVHGAILMRRGDAGQVAQAQVHGIEPIDMLVVNLYPFAQTLAGHSSVHEQEVIEQIDIGGVALIRAGSKNYEDVAVLTEPADYPSVLEEMQKSSALSADTKRRLAARGFAHTAAYDGDISGAFARAQAGGGPPQTLNLNLKLAQPMRYGENPHQQAALYSPDGKLSFEQLHGKELSYNNILDAHGSWEAVCDFGQTAAVIFKHITPCGAATGATAEEAFSRAWECDPLSAFGGVIAFNCKVSPKAAEMVNSFFVEIIIAPDYEDAALDILRAKKNIRILSRAAGKNSGWVIRSAGREILAGEADSAVSAGQWKQASKRAPSGEEMRALEFAWIVCKHVRSNAIALCAPDRTVGIGAGQMSRVDAVKTAEMKFSQYLAKNPRPKTLVLASDAFFPFRDAVDEAARLGASAIVQPGGSQRDAESIQAADERGLAMMFTGMRHFRH
ncbi:MAG: bifunctional phosphoribosylaminoimidazolecarboxamide formyltransferase/IMP cyclohydrolase [Elusimicrobiales bacterium]